MTTALFVYFVESVEEKDSHGLHEFSSSKVCPTNQIRQIHDPIA